MTMSYADDVAHICTAIAMSYVGDATMLYVGHRGAFKIPGAIRHLCLRSYPHKLGPRTPKF